MNDQKPFIGNPSEMREFRFTIRSTMIERTLPIYAHSWESARAIARNYNKRKDPGKVIKIEEVRQGPPRPRHWALPQR